MSLSTFKHGIYYTESTTETAPNVQYGQIPVYIGTAPVNLATAPAPANKPILVSTIAEFKEKFGFVDDFSYTLCEVADYHFTKANIAPIICINVLDSSSATFKQTAQSEIVVKDGSVFTLSAKGILKDTVTVKGISNYTEGDEDDENFSPTDLTASDYILSFDTDGSLVITPEATGNITSSMNALQVSFSKLNPSAVTGAHIIGSIDTSTGERTGLQAIDHILGEIGQPPGMIVAPGFSHIPTVTQAFIEKSKSVSGNFPALVIADIDSSVSGSPYASGVKAWKDNNGFIYKDLVVCFPMAKVGNKVYHLSTIVAATKQSTLTLESAYGTPCESPSNKPTEITSLVNMKGEDIIIDIVTANHLNEVGVVTALKMALDFVVWGNYTSVYPDSSDPRDIWISTRSLFHYLVDIIIMTYWKKIDERSTETNIQNVEDGVNNWLNSLATKEVLKEGECKFLGISNKGTNGDVNFEISWADIKPSQSYNFNYKFNASAYEN